MTLHCGKLSLKSLCKSYQIQLPGGSGKNTINKKTGILLHEDTQNYYNKLLEQMGDIMPIRAQL